MIRVETSSVTARVGRVPVLPVWMEAAGSDRWDCVDVLAVLQL